MRALGIDPGLSGGIAVVDGPPHRNRPALIAAIDVPVLTLDPGRVDLLAVMRLIERLLPIDLGLIERAGLMPDQDVGAGTRYMRAVGYLEAAVVGMGIDLKVIETSAWKKYHALYGEPKVEGEKIGKRKVRLKEKSRQRALALFDQPAELARKMDHNRAEAALIAVYGLSLLPAGFRLIP